MAETLVDYKGSRVDQFVPLLATSWQANANKSVWTFHLRHGVRFHTGRCCMTAADVRYSLARTVLAGLAGAYIYGRYMKDPLKQIAVLDPYTLRFNLGRPQYTFLNAIGTKNAGVILDARALKAHASKSDPWAHNWITDHDAGTGPYVLTNWQRGQQVILTRFPGYWGGWSGRHFSKVIIRTVPEESTRRELVEKGQADLSFGFTPQDIVVLSKNPALRVVAPYGTEVDYVVMTEAGPLVSPAARQALSYAFNYDAFITAGFKGYAKRAYGPLASTLFGYDPHMFHYHTDLTKARALLRKAGVKPGTTLTYLYATGYQTLQLAGLILQAQLAQLGFTVKLRGVDQATQGTIFFGNAPPSRRPNLMGYGWWPDYNDPWDACVPLVASYSAGANGANAGFYHNKQVDALLAEMKNAGAALLASDARKLQDITGRVDPPAIWIDEPAQVSVLAHNLRGYVFNPLDLQTYGYYPMYRG
jgi:peptide/nickel transport system substrate-binding protein